MKKFNIHLGAKLALVLALTGLSAQATMAQTADAAQSAEATSESASSSASSSASAAPTVTKLNEVPAPAAGMGQIVFFRPSRMVGMAVSFSVREGDKGVGKLTNGTYFVLDVEPGTKEYNISFEAKDTLRLEVEEGETYYVIQSIGMGVVAARPNLTPSTEQDFQAKKLKLTKAVATDKK